MASSKCFSAGSPTLLATLIMLDFDLFTAPQQKGQAVWCFDLRDRHQPTLKLGDELERVDSLVTVGCQSSQV
jgi:hypothetical protein